MDLSLSLSLSSVGGAAASPDPLAPANTVAPSIGGLAYVNQILTGSDGSWTNTPTSYTRQWYANGVAIGGATGGTYQLTTGETGKVITFAVTALKTSHGQATATSAPTATVLDDPLRGYGDGLFIDYTTDEAVVVHSATPANNYHGSASALVTKVGSPGTGPHGGMLVSTTAKYAKLALTSFPWNDTEGTIVVELARADVTVDGNFIDVWTSVGGHEAIGIKNSPGNGYRFVCGSSNMDRGTRTYSGVPHCVAAAYKANDMAMCYDGADPVKITSGAVGVVSGFIFMGAWSGGADYAEIMRVWYFPERLTDAALLLFTPRDRQVFYIDSAAGNDSNNGLSTAQALAGVSGLSGKKVRYSDEISFKRASRQRMSPWSLWYGMRATAYGSGNKPVLDASRGVSAGAWAADGTYANVYKATVVYENATTPSTQPFYPNLFLGDLIGRDRLQMWAASATSYNLALGSKVFPVAAGRDIRVGDRVMGRRGGDRLAYWMGVVTAYSGTSLTVNVTYATGSGTSTDWTIWVTCEFVGIWGGANIVANRAALLPGTFTCHRSGSTVENPNSDSGATTYVFYARMPDDSNPALATSEIAYGEPMTMLTLTGGERLSDLVLMRCAIKDFSSKVAGDQLLYTDRVEVLDMGGHGFVDSPAVHTDGLFHGALSSRTRADSGGFHFFRDDTSFGIAPACAATNCVAIGAGNGFYSHGTGGGDEQVRVDIGASTSIDCGAGNETGKTTQGWHISAHTYVNCTVNGHLNYPLLDVET